MTVQVDQETFTMMFEWLHGESLAILMGYEMSNTENYKGVEDGTSRN